MKVLLIRTARESDLDVLAGLYMDLYDTLDGFGLPFSLDLNSIKDILSVMLKSKLCCVLVAEYKGTVCGFLTAGIARMDRKLKFAGESTIGTIHDVYIAPDYREKHIAAQMLQKAETWFRDNGVKIIESNILVENRVSAAFFHKNGYKELARIVYKEL